MFELRSKMKWYCPPGKWFYGPTPLPSGISWASDPPTPLEFPIPSMVGVWISSGTTHLWKHCTVICPFWKHSFNCKVLVQWNPVNKDTEGTHHSVCIIRVSILRGLSGKKKDWSITPRKSDLLYVVGREAGYKCCIWFQRVCYSGHYKVSVLHMNQCAYKAG